MQQLNQITDPLHVYQISKRGNSLRVKAEAVRWGRPRARVNTISPGIVFTPFARDELSGPGGEGYRRMIELCPAKRGGPRDEVGVLGALMMGPDGVFITGSDFLIDGGVTASYLVRRTRSEIIARREATFVLTSDHYCRGDLNLGSLPPPTRRYRMGRGRQRRCR